jgi:hypothetical protein
MQWGLALALVAPSHGWLANLCCAFPSPRLKNLPPLVSSSVLQKAGRDTREVSSDWKELYGPLTCGLHVDVKNSGDDDIDSMLAKDPARFHHISSLVLNHSMPMSSLSTPFPQLVSLSLDYHSTSCEMTDEVSSQNVIAGLSSLSALTALRDLSVYGEYLDTQQLDVLLEAMAVRGQRQTLTSLDLAGGCAAGLDCPISERGLQSFQILAGGLKSVALCSNPADFCDFCDLLGTMTRVTTLTVCGDEFDATDHATWLESSRKLSALANLVELCITDYSVTLMRAALRSMSCLTNLRRLELALHCEEEEDFALVDADFYHIGSLHPTLTSLHMSCISGHAFTGIVGRLTVLQHLDLPDARNLVEEPEFPQCLTLLPPSLRHLALPRGSIDHVPADVLAALKAAADARGHALEIQ